MASLFLEQLCRHFNAINFYEILNASKQATPEQLYTAFLKRSLEIHPDRLKEKELNGEVHQYELLTHINAILQHKEKREAYDRFQTIPATNVKAMALFVKIIRRHLYPEDKPTMAQLQKLQLLENYRGSDLEIEDIKWAYILSEGDMGTIVASVPYGSISYENWYEQVIEYLIEKGEVPKFPSFFDEDQKKKEHRHKIWIAEKQYAYDMSSLCKIELKRRTAIKHRLFEVNKNQKHVDKNAKTIELIRNIT